jgi:hypothetical protein
MGVINFLQKIWKKIKKIFKRGDDVPQGLQVFDEKGKVVVDITDRITKMTGMKVFSIVEDFEVTIPITGNEVCWVSACQNGSSTSKLPKDWIRNPFDFDLIGNTLKVTAPPQLKGKHCTYIVFWGVC